jgi:hypothetical protein
MSNASRSTIFRAERLRRTPWCSSSNSRTLSSPDPSALTRYIQLPIANGRVVHDSLTFDCKWGNGTLLHFALGAHGDEIQGQGRGDEKDVPKNPDENYTNVFYLTMKRASSH